MDDGYAIYGKNRNISTVGIALCAFTSEELIKFTEFLYQKFNLKFKIHKHHSKRYNKDYLNLYLCAESFNLFQKVSISIFNGLGQVQNRKARNSVNLRNPESPQATLIQVLQKCKKGSTTRFSNLST